MAPRTQTGQIQGEVIMIPMVTSIPFPSRMQVITNNILQAVQESQMTAADNQNLQTAAEAARLTEFSRDGLHSQATQASQTTQDVNLPERNDVLFFF